MKALYRKFIKKSISFPLLSRCVFSDPAFPSLPARHMNSALHLNKQPQSFPVGKQRMLPV